MSSETEQEPDGSGEIVAEVIESVRQFLLFVWGGLKTLDGVILWFIEKGLNVSGRAWRFGARLFGNGFGKPLIRVIAYSAVGIYVLWKVGVIAFVL